MEAVVSQLSQFPLLLSQPTHWASGILRSDNPLEPIRGGALVGFNCPQPLTC
jgi:hypothetical protein